MESSMSVQGAKRKRTRRKSGSAQRVHAAERANTSDSLAADAEDTVLATAVDEQLSGEPLSDDDAYYDAALGEEVDAPAREEARERQQTPRAERLRQTASEITRSVAARSLELTHGAWRHVRNSTAEHWLWVGLTALPPILRFWGLGDKPLHHDESMHAFYSYMYARNPSGYEYDPLLHGPFQFHAVGIFFALVLGLQHLFGVGGAAANPWINDTTAR